MRKSGPGGEPDYFDFIAQAGKLLRSTGSRLVKINMVLSMLLDTFSIRNPILLVRDNVTGDFNIELAPELTEQESSRASRELCEYISRYPHQFAYEHMLFPDEARSIPVIIPEVIEEGYSIFVSIPIYGRDKGFYFGVLIAFLRGDEQIKERAKLLSVMTDMIGLHLAAREVGARVFYEPSSERIPMALEGVVGESLAIRKIGDIVKRVSTSRASVFIRGESGTGKELIAKAIHKSSLRSRAPFISVNCAALSDSLLASELFGHEKGAFTGAVSAKKGRFELASGGTIFLDEIGDTSLSFQTKLLRVLQEGEFERVGGSGTIKVDVRVICATNADIEEAIHERAFREDLFYRLNVIPITMPPLRERAEDIPLLVKYFLQKLNIEYGKSVKISRGDVEFLMGLRWPGNVRELENFLSRAYVMERNGMINVEAALDMGDWAAEPPDPAPSVEEHAPIPVERDVMVEEILAIESALKASRGVQTRAAEILGITLRQLRYRIKKYGIKVRKIHA
ncbi:MAG: sigma-54 interaction domain-containing protein [Candidatus Nitrospinota bacterium M3_3B_026]